MMGRNNLIKSTMSMLAVLLLLPLGTNAQWSADPLENLGIAVATGDQALPKIVETSDGGCYISWFDNRSGSYCVYLQLLNSQGEIQWTPNGMLISDHPQMTWLVDYDMTVDQNDNAVVVFSDIRNGGSNELDVFAYKIGSNGSFLWGPDGVGLSETTNSDFEPAPKITVTREGNLVVAWPKSGTRDILCFQRLLSDGQKMWGENGITLSGGTGESLSSPDLVQAEDDAVIAYWKNSTGPPWAPTTNLYTQKIAPDGSVAWNPSGVLIYNLGSISAWTYPLIYPDENGGAFYTWYDSPSLSEFNVRVQHVDSAGNLVFPLNGVQASTNSNDRLHMYPTLSYLPPSDELFVFWVEENWGQSQYGVYGQKFSPLGDRLWTDSGLEFVGLGPDQISFVCSMPADNSIYIGYFESPSVMNTAVKAFRIDPDGNMFWTPNVLSSATLGNKDDLLLVVNSENRAFLTWDDGRNDIGDIYAQNVNPDGSLGNPIAHTVTVTLTPVNPPVVIPSNGGTFDFNIEVTNSGSNPETFDIWTMATLPNGNEYGPIINVPDFTAPANWSANRDRTQNVPGNAPAGMYTYDAYVGVYPNDVWDEDHFDFEKLGGGGDSQVITWECWGEGFDNMTNQISSKTPDDIALYGTHPNPFNPTTTISFMIPEASYVQLSIYDITGRLVDKAVNGWQDAGIHEVTFDASCLSSGIYVYQLQTGDFSASGKMILLK